MNALSVVDTVLVHNEADILGQLPEHLHEHGISFVLLDGGSEDGSIKIANAYDSEMIYKQQEIAADHVPRELHCFRSQESI